jgi:hypothetical protein
MAVDTGHRLPTVRSVSMRSVIKAFTSALYNESWWIEKDCHWLVHNEMKEIRNAGVYGVM